MVSPQSFRTKGVSGSDKSAVTFLSGKDSDAAAAVTFLSGKDSGNGESQKQRMVQLQSLSLVNSFQRTSGVALSDHASISGSFMVQAWPCCNSHETIP